MTKVCQHCSNEFSGKRTIAKFCSDTCKNASWQAKNKHRVSQAIGRYKKTDKFKAYRENNKDTICQQIKEWKLNNADRRKELDKNYHRRNRHNPEYLAKRRHSEAKRRAVKLSATPRWLTVEQKRAIKDIYLNCPKGFEVDHIFPLRGKTVCGLHVPENLQYLKREENRSKGNRIR